MSHEALKQGSTQSESVAFQYRREQVAREMANVYSAFGNVPSRASNTVAQSRVLAKDPEPSKR